MNDNYKQDWNDAVDNFVIAQYQFATGGTTYVHAEAGTGSKYEVYGTFIRSDWRDKGNDTFFIAVANPWQRVWTTQHDSWAFPDYAVEHWGSPNRSRSEMHGGDAAAITMCVNVVLGHTLADVFDIAREWGR
jgi:hypothetical protein